MCSLGRLAVLCTAGLLLSAGARAQEPFKPGPEHELLKKHAGAWDADVDFAGNKSKGVMTFKMELGGLFLTSSFKGEFLGQPFEGRGMDTYDPLKKKFVSVWADSMGPSILVMEGTYDKESKSLTYTGEGPGMDGKMTKWKSVSKLVDDDTINFTYFVPDKDGKEQKLMTINYKRKK